MMLVTLLTAMFLWQPLTPAHADNPGITDQTPQGNPNTLRGVWKGSIKLPGGSNLDCILTITAPDAALLSIPAQGLTDAPLSKVTITATTMAFSLVIPNAPSAASPVFDLAVAPDGTASGTMRQSGLTLAVSLTRLAPGEEGKPARPQTPVPPFRYIQRTVATTSFDGAAINGTLTIPQEDRFGEGPFACVLFISGSGTQDRDETIFEHKPFAVLADALALAGVASLRVDDRGYDGAHDPLGLLATTETFVNDTKSVLEFLAVQPGIDPSRIGLIGHSEGGLIAPAVAAARPPGQAGGVAFIVLLAAPGVPGIDLLPVQAAAILKAQGLPPREAEVAVAAQQAALAAVASGDRDALTKALRSSLEQGGLRGEALEAALEAAMKQSESAWLRHFLTRDPRADLSRVTCPALVINGGKDVQVDAAQNVPAVVAALMQSRSDADVTARVFPGLNHLLQPVGPTGTGGVEEYARIETTIDTAAIHLIVDWITSITQSQRSEKAPASTSPPTSTRPLP